MNKPKHFSREDKCSVVVHGRVIGHVYIRRHYIEFIENGKLKTIADPKKPPEQVDKFYPKK